MQNLEMWEILALACLCLLVVILAAMIVALIWWIVYDIYRLMAYDYDEETLSAQVIDKDYQGSHWILVGKVPVYYDAEYNVCIKTDNGFAHTIDSEELYGWAEKGRELQVTVKVGRSRKGNREVKYERIIDYSFN